MAAAGIGLERVFLDSQRSVKALGQPLQVVFRGQSADQATLPLQNGVGAGETQPGQLGSTQAAQVGVGRVQGLAHGTAGQELPQTCRLGAGGAQTVQQLFLRQAQQLGGGNGGG